MTSLKCDSLKNRRFLRALAEYLKNSSTDFHQTYVILMKSYIDVFLNYKIEDRSSIVDMVTNL